MEVLEPNYLRIGRYAHMKGPSFHFHFIPVYDKVFNSFLRDKRYRFLKELHYRMDGVFAERQFDACELQLYVWREFCVSPTPPQTQGPSVSKVLALLKDFTIKKINTFANT